MTKRHSYTYNIERHLFYIATVLLGACSCAYIYFVSASVVHVVVRKEIHQEIARTETRISELESQYIQAKDAIVESVALERGFQKNEAQIFVTRKPTTVVRTFNDEG
jgi:hypothetical protein